MARHGRRIKRCGTCVERKVKCDEQQPHSMYFGRIHQDKQACNQGLRLYSYALTQLRSEINSSSTDMGTIMGVMCLCVYENVVFSQPTAWLLHYDGLGRLLQSRGPKPLETEAERQIWRVARYFIILSAGHQRKRIFLEQPQWASIHCIPQGETPEKFDLLLDMFAQFPGIIEDYDRLRKSTFIHPDTREAFRQRVQSLIDRIHAWLRNIPWICTLDPTTRENSQGQLPDDPMDCASLAVCYAILLCLIQPCDCLKINIIPDHDQYNVDPARIDFLTLEICRFSSWALRGGDTANLALLLIYPLQITWFFLQGTPEKLHRVRENLDLGIADTHGFELGRMREWNELNLEQGRYGFMYK
ncbi:hypothetical protein FSHL1_008469 [Fusarium sambucinum]